MIVSLLYRLTRALLALSSVLLRREAVKDAQLLVLRHENAVLRRQLKGPVRYEALRLPKTHPLWWEPVCVGSRYIDRVTRVGTLTHLAINAA
jgi:hypothetical protein